MMNAIRINNVGKSFPSRQAARDYANQEGGKVVDLLSVKPGTVNVLPSFSRWVVVFNRVICTPHLSKLIRNFSANTVKLGKTQVMTKKAYRAAVIRSERVNASK